MTSKPWFELVGSNQPITQGDIILDCPVLGWQGNTAPSSLPNGSFDISTLAEIALRDVVVLTQACDLEHNKVHNVVLCPAVRLSEFRLGWEADSRRRNQNPTDKAWRRICEDIASGIVWSQCFLDASSDATVPSEIRVVVFTEVYTLPRATIETVLQNRGGNRLRLRPPYREHLSQSFARFFMRVGLPQAIDLP